MTDWILTPAPSSATRIEMRFTSEGICLMCSLEIMSCTFKMV